MAKKLRRFRWSALKHISRAQARVMNALLASFPQTPFERGFKDRLREVLEPMLHADVDIWFSGVDVVEADGLGRRLADPCCAGVLGLVGRDERCLAELDLPMAQLIIDKLLGGDGGDVDQQRPLSEIEEGVYSFVLLKVLNLVQETMGSERSLALKLEGMHGSLAALTERFALEEPFVVVSFKLFVDRTQGVLRLYIPTSLVEGLFTPSWPAEGPALERLLQSYGDRKELVRLLRTPLTVEVGRLSLGMTDLDSLEEGDIVLVEQTDASMLRREDLEDPESVPGYLAGQVTCRIGQGGHGTLLGNVAVGESGRYEVAIENIVPAGEPSGMRFLFPDVDDGVEAFEEEGMGEASRRLANSAEDALALAARAREAAAARALVGQPARFTAALGPSQSEAAVERTAEHSDGYEDDALVEEDEIPDAAAASLLDDVTVAMVVELGRVMVSAADVMGLRPGQVIELSRAPGEPVDLVVDGKRIGKGELVEIDGELGVRILSLAR